MIIKTKIIMVMKNNGYHYYVKPDSVSFIRLPLPHGTVIARLLQKKIRIRWTEITEKISAKAVSWMWSRNRTNGPET